MIENDLSQLGSHLGVLRALPGQVGGQRSGFGRGTGAPRVVASMLC